MRKKHTSVEREWGDQDLLLRGGDLDLEYWGDLESRDLDDLHL